MSTNMELAPIRESQLTVNLGVKLLEDNSGFALQSIDVPSSADGISKNEDAREEIAKRVQNPKEQVPPLNGSRWCDIHLSNNETNEDMYVEAKGTSDKTRYNFREGNGKFLIEAQEELSPNETYIFAVPDFEAKDLWEGWTNRNGNLSWDLKLTIMYGAIVGADFKFYLCSCSDKQIVKINWVDFLDRDFSEYTSGEIIEEIE